MTKNIPCKYCGATTSTRTLDTLSTKGEPMKEIEAKCNSCEARYII
jgi:hypothetical protein